MQPDDIALGFACEGEHLFGILSPAAAAARRGVLVVVGGPQYRAGSHRQFTLLARALAAQGIPVLRFDYRGMGDGCGDARNFEAVHADLRAAIDAFTSAVPGLQEVVIWGLCDAASAALFYARHDARVTGLVLLNPWVRTPEGQARATLKHYYLQRLMQPELWRKLFSGQFKFGAALSSLRSQLGAARGASASPAAPAPAPAAAASAPAAGGTALPQLPGLPQRMLAGWQGFKGPVLLVTSGKDLTAKEFLDLAGCDKGWRKALQSPRVTRRDLAPADHTFSRREWRDQVAAWTADWVRAW